MINVLQSGLSVPQYQFLEFELLLSDHTKKANILCQLIDQEIEFRALRIQLKQE